MHVCLFQLINDLFNATPFSKRRTTENKKLTYFQINHYCCDASISQLIRCYLQGRLLAADWTLHLTYFPCPITQQNTLPCRTFTLPFTGYPTINNTHFTPLDSHDLSKICDFGLLLHHHSYVHLFIGRACRVHWCTHWCSPCRRAQSRPAAESFRPLQKPQPLQKPRPLKPRPQQQPWPWPQQ